MKHSEQAWLGRYLPVLLAGVVIGFVCGLQALHGLFPGFDLFERLELMSYDWRARRTFDTNAPVANLGVIFIDDQSLDQVNRNFEFSWPWPRQLHGRLISELSAQGAKVVGFDILFQELQASTPETAVRLNGQTMTSDDYFAQELHRAGNVILAAVGEQSASGWQVLLPAAKFRTNAWRVGHISSDADADGVLRRARAFYDDPVHGRFWHMGILLAARGLGLDLSTATVEPGWLRLRGPGEVARDIPLDAGGYFYIDWSLDWNDSRLTKESFENVLLAEMSRARGATNLLPVWKDKIVVVGSIGSGNNIRDFGATPLSSQTYLLSKHWNVANSILLDRFIHRSNYLTETLLILLLGAVSAVVTWRLRALVASALVLLALVLYATLGVLLFSAARYWLPLVLPGLGALLMTHVSMVTYRVVVEQKERHRIRSVFAKVVAPDIVSELLRAKTLALGGARRKVTVYFADIRGFTRLTDDSQATAEDYVKAHRLSPAAAEAYLDERAREVLTTVNLYLGLAADTIKRHHGTLDKYIGDCVMAFWGAPTPSDRQAVDCVRAAIDAQLAVYELNLHRAAENRRREDENRARLAAGLPPLPPLMLLALGSGINTGMVTAGLMGSDQHQLNYTVFGREVNLASRLEGLSGRGRIIISESTFRELERLAPDQAGLCAGLPRATVKGIREQVQVYEVQWRRLVSRPTAFDTELVTDAEAALTDGRPTDETA